MTFFLLLVLQWNFSGGDSGSIKVPIDHLNPNSKRIEIYYTFDNDFIEERKTVFVLDDPLDGVFRAFHISDQIKENFNIVRIEGRHQLQTLKDEIISSNKIDWKKAYQVYNQNQIASDIELIRAKLLGEREVILIGHSSSASTFIFYTSRYPIKVSQVICLSPLIFDIQRNLRFDRSLLRIEDIDSTLSQNQEVNFNFYSTYDFLNGTPEVRKSALQSAILHFKYNHYLLPGFSNILDDDIGLKVRMFEHSYAYVDQNDNSQIEPNSIREWLYENSKDLWDEHTTQNFDVHGVHYDKGDKYLGNIFILGGAFDLLINSNSYEILAEFFRHSTLLLLKDGHSLNKIRSAGLLDNLILAIMKNDFDKKVEALDALHDYELVFHKKIPPLKKKKYW